MKEIEFLNKYYNTVLKELKKEMFPKYSRRKIITSPVEFKLVDKVDYAGRCIAEKNSEWSYKFTIEVERGYLNLAMNGSYKGKWKRYHRNRLKNLLEHEIIHAHIKENYCFDKIGFDYDGSFVHAAMCWFLGISINEAPRQIFIMSEFYKDVQECKSFEELERRLIKYMCLYERKLGEHECFIEGNIIYQNTFLFDNGDTGGMKVAYKTVGVTDDGKIYIGNIITIGMLQDIFNLREDIVKKVDKYKKVVKVKENLKRNLKINSMCI